MISKMEQHIKLHGQAQMGDTDFHVWLDRKLAQVRAEALEEAAKVCDEIFERVKSDAVMHGINVDDWGSCERAAAIRGLK